MEAGQSGAAYPAGRDGLACVAGNLAVLALAGLAVVEDGKEEASRIAFFAATHLAAIDENLECIGAVKDGVVGEVWGHEDAKKAFVLVIDYQFCWSAEGGEAEAIVFYNLAALSHPAEILFAFARDDKREVAGLLQKVWSRSEEKVDGKESATQTDTLRTTAATGAAPTGIIVKSGAVL